MPGVQPQAKLTTHPFRTLSSSLFAWFGRKRSRGTGSIGTLVVVAFALICSTSPTINNKTRLSEKKNKLSLALPCVQWHRILYSESSQQTNQLEKCRKDFTSDVPFSFN